MSFLDDSIKNIFFYDETADQEITDHVIFGSFRLENILCSDDFNIGECNSARAEFETSENLDLTGHIIRVEYGTASDKAIVGTYKVSQTETAINTSVCKIIAYDCVKEFDADLTSWLDGVVFPITLKNFRDSLCAYVGITQESVTLPQDDILLDETFETYELNGRDLLRWIGQINACFPHSSNIYTLDWITLPTAPQRVPNEAFIGANALRSKGFTTPLIEGVVIMVEEGDVGGYAGSFTNRLEIIGNPLMFGRSDLDQIADSILYQIMNVSYTPCEIDIKYLPDIKIGDFLRVGSTLFYNFGYKISGAMECTIICEGVQDRGDAGSITTDLIMLKGKSNVLRRDVDSMSNEIKDVDAGWKSAVKQTADSFTVEIADVYGELDGSRKVYYVDEEPLTPNNNGAGGTYPTYDFTKSIPVRELADNPIQLGEGIKFVYTDEWFREYRRALAYDETHVMAYRFNTSSGIWKWIPIPDSNFGITMSRVVTLEATSEGITAEIETIKETHYTKTETDTAIRLREESIYLGVAQKYYDKASGNALNSKVSKIEIDLNGITSEVSDISTGLTDTQTKVSTIEQTAKSITSTVKDISETVDGQNSKISEIKQTADSISGEVSKKLDSEGGTKTSFKYELTATGFNLYSNNTQVFKCDRTGVSITGDITATTGKIGNLTIAGGSIYDGKTTLTDANEGIRINKSGIALGANNAFKVTSAGVLTCKAGTIGGCTIDSSGHLIVPSAYISGKLSTAQLDASVVTTKNLSSQKISADAITAGTLDCSKVSVANLNASSITSGTISASRLDSSVVKTNTIQSAINNLEFVSLRQLRWDANIVTSNSTVMLVPVGDRSGAYTAVSLAQFRRALGI